MSENLASPTRSLAPELLDAYRRTDFVVKSGNVSFTLKVDVFSAELQALFEETGFSSAAFVTAFNPYSVNQSNQTNHIRQSQLTDDIAKAGHPQIEGFGRGEGEGQGWVEESVLVLGLAFDEAMSYAKKYEQNAFVWIDSDCIPSLVVSI